MASLKGSSVIALFAALGLCFGCSSAPSQTPSAPVASNPSAEESLDFPLIGTLPSRRVTPESCGMFIWRAASRTELVFYHETGPRGAIMLLDDARVRFRLTEVSGEAFYGQRGTQKFEGRARDKRDLRVEVSVSRGPTFDGGLYVTNGVLRVWRDGGPRKVIPVNGVAGCRDDQDAPLSTR